MTLTQLINRPCTIVKRATSESSDDYGDALDTETTVSTVCEIQQRQSSESDDEVSATRWIGFFLPGTEIAADDGVQPEGMGDFEIDGDPWEARNPRTQATSHIEANLRQIGGPDDIPAAS